MKQSELRCSVLNIPKELRRASMVDRSPDRMEWEESHEGTDPRHGSEHEHFWLISDYFLADKDDRCFPSSFLDCKRMHSMIVDEIVEAAMFKRTKNSNSWPAR